MCATANNEPAMVTELGVQYFVKSLVTTAVQTAESLVNQACVAVPEWNQCSLTTQGGKGVQEPRNVHRAGALT